MPFNKAFPPQIKHLHTNHKLFHFLIQPTSRPTPISAMQVKNILYTDSEVASFGCAADSADFPASSSFDSNTKKYVCIKSTDEDEFGIVVSPSHQLLSIAEKIRVYASDDCYNCDPISGKIEGRITSSNEWVVVSEGDFDWISLSRNPADTAIASTYENGDASLNFVEVTMDNNQAYRDYKLTFSSRFSTSPLMLAEVELVGLLIGLSPTPKPTTPQPTPIPTPKPTIPGALLVGNIFYENSVASTFGCGSFIPARYSFDKTTNKFICTKGSFDQGIIVSPSHYRNSIAEKIRVYANNNCENCDPITYKIEGRGSDSGPWNLVAKGDFSWGDNPPRNPASTEISSTYFYGDASLTFTEASFPNSVSYWQYRLTFNSRSTTTSLELAEVELVGMLVGGAPVSFVQ